MKDECAAAESPSHSTLDTGEKVRPEEIDTKARDEEDTHTDDHQQ
jgi:hypothetical protein